MSALVKMGIGQLWERNHPVPFPIASLRLCTVTLPPRVEIACHLPSVEYLLLLLWHIVPRPLSPMEYNVHSFPWCFLSSRLAFKLLPAQKARRSPAVGPVHSCAYTEEAARLSGHSEVPWGILPYPITARNDSIHRIRSPVDSLGNHTGAGTCSVDSISCSLLVFF